MGSFKGFDPNGFMLLEMNKFNDSRDFYESVKEDIKKMSIVPMRNLCADLSDELYRIDPKMNLVPTKMVSRVRRDTRYSKNKQMYRSNIWCMFMRDKHQWENFPCMWFEFFPDGYSYGVAMFRFDATGLGAFRQKLIEKPKEFRRALTSIEITGAQLFLDLFKKNKPDIEKVDDDLKIFYNAKDFGFTYHSNNMQKLIDGSIIEELTYAVRAFEPMYKFLSEITDELVAKGE
ncbi:MAG: DUF2461 family protein [Clostridia bacterium]|nr:DUF2461 family protein [Clostridia bacterium]